MYMVYRQVNIENLSKEIKLFKKKKKKEPNKNSRTEEMMELKDLKLQKSQWTWKHQYKSSNLKNWEKKNEGKSAVQTYGTIANSPTYMELESQKKSRTKQNRKKMYLKK